MTLSEVRRSPLDPSLARAAAALRPVGLTEVVARAAAQRRMDRKYLVPVADATALLAVITASHHRLVVADRLTTTYRSTYLDSGDLRCCRDHLQGRRLRWKARQRIYVEDRLCRLEVKVRTGRGETEKHALDLAPDQYGTYDAAMADAVDRLMDGAGCGRAPADLGPVLEVSYDRLTLADLDTASRVTLDTAVLAVPLRCEDGRSRVLPTGTVALDPRYVVVETKGGVRAGEVDRLLLARGHRPGPLSKYATSAALLSPDIADNSVRHLRGRQLHVTTEDAPC